MSDVRTRAQEALKLHDERTAANIAAWKAGADSFSVPYRVPRIDPQIVRDLLAENTQLEAKITAALELHRYRGNRSLLDCSCGPSLLPCPTRRILSGDDS